MPRLLAAGEPMPLEDFNRYAVIIDADGNGWSDRLRLLLHYNTAILKQASNLTGQAGPGEPTRVARLCFQIESMVTGAVVCRRLVPCAASQLACAQQAATAALGMQPSSSMWSRRAST